MTIPEIARRYDRPASTLRAAIRRLVARGVLPQREGRDHHVPERLVPALLAEARTTPGRPPKVKSRQR